MTTRIGFLGNCQVQSWAFLAPLMVPGAEVITFDYSSAESRDEDFRRAFVEKLASCDHIFAQLASFSITNERELRERFGAKVVTVANFYFRGLFPDSCYVGSFDHRLGEPTAVHSVVILDAFLRGMSEENAARSFTRENYARLGLLDAWALSMEEMRRREANNVVEVPGAEMMEASCRRYPAFLTMNHPSSVMLADYLHKAFTYAGLAHQEINAAIHDDPLDLYDITPIDDIVAEVQQLPYRGTQRWRFNSPRRGFIDRAELVRRFYAVYQETPRDRLVVNSPTDLVEQYRNDPQLRFLVDAAAPVIGAPIRVSDLAPQYRQASLQQVEGTLDAILAKSEEVRTYIHKLHSFHEIADPKIEALRHIVIDHMRPKLDGLVDAGTRLAPQPESEAGFSDRHPVVTRILRFRRLLLVMVLLTFISALLADFVARLILG